MSANTPSEGGQSVDDLLEAFERACADVVAEVAANGNATRLVKHRSILRNEIRGRLLAARSSAPSDELADRVTRFFASRYPDVPLAGLAGRLRHDEDEMLRALLAAPIDVLKHPDRFLVRVEKPGGLRFYECTAPTLDEAAEGVGLQRRAAPSEGAAPATPNWDDCPDCDGFLDRLGAVTDVLEKYSSYTGNPMYQELWKAALGPASPVSTPEQDDDARNLDALVTVCEDLKRRLVPFGASADGWDSAIATLKRARLRSLSGAPEAARVSWDGDTGTRS